MRRQKKTENKFIRRSVLTAVTILSLFVIIVSVVVILNLSKENYYSPPSRYEQARSTIIEDTETLGWISVQGTDIDYPVVYETAQVYVGLKDYLWLSNRYIEGNNRIPIYGHNVKNVSNKPLMRDKENVRFEQLLSFVYYDFAKENLYIQYSQNGNDQLYKIYAIGFYNKDEEEGYSLDNSKEVREYIDEVKENSIYDYSVDVNEDDFLISLITCTRFFGASEKTTFKIDARKVRDGEKINKYGVQKNKNYDILNLE